MESMLGTALITAIAIENRSLNFYSAVLSRVTDTHTRRVFERLAQEEETHLESFCNLYPGHRDELGDILSKNSINADPYFCSLLDSIDGNSIEKNALWIAFKEEQSCIEWYSVFVNTIREPRLHEVFVRALDDTNRHCEMISDEYIRLLNRWPGPTRITTSRDTNEPGLLPVTG